MDSSTVTNVCMPLTVFIALLLISCWKRRWFHNEPGHSNPYKTVYRILRFVKNHTYPIKHSVLTHCDNYIPSRLDYAKDRCGGPLSTEQVKTFIWILLVLFPVGPVFSKEVAASDYVFPLASFHIIHHSKPQLYIGRKLLKLLSGIGIFRSTFTTVVLFPA